MSARADVPDASSQSFTTFAHLLVSVLFSSSPSALALMLSYSRSPNVPLSAASSSISLSSLPSTLSYVPPHPQKGTPYHRYTVLLFEQPSQLTLDGSAIERAGFSTREFIKEHELKPSGVSFFRQVWDKDVSKIYKEVLSAFFFPDLCSPESGLLTFLSLSSQTFPSPALAVHQSPTSTPTALPSTHWSNRSSSAGNELCKDFTSSESGLSSKASGRASVLATLRREGRDDYDYFFLISR